MQKDQIPYSRKYWRLLNLAVWPQTERKKYWQNLNLANFNLVVSTPTAKLPNFNPRQIFRLYGIVQCTGVHRHIVPHADIVDLL